MHAWCRRGVLKCRTAPRPCMWCARPRVVHGNGQPWWQLLQPIRFMFERGREGPAVCLEGFGVGDRSGVEVGD